MREPAPSLEGLLSFVPGRRRRHPGGDARSSDEAALLIRHGVVIRRCSRTSMLGQASTFLSFQPNRVAPTGHEHEALQRASFEAARCDRPRRRHARTAAAAPRRRARRRSRAGSHGRPPPSQPTSVTATRCEPGRFSPSWAAASGRALRGSPCRAASAPRPASLLPHRVGRSAARSRYGRPLGLPAPRPRRLRLRGCF
jgi:hypothetical protein